jgi:hypothetical protein
MSSLYRGKRAEAGRGAQVLGLGIILPAVEAMADALMGARECCTHSPTIQITIQALFMLLILFIHLLVRLGASQLRTMNDERWTMSDENER